MLKVRLIYSYVGDWFIFIPFFCKPLKSANTAKSGVSELTSCFLYDWIEIKNENIGINN